MYKSVIDKLKMLIENNGPDYLYTEPYLTYRELADSSDIDNKLAGAILLVLIRNVFNYYDFENNRENLSELIQNKCCFNKEMSDRLAEIFCKLYSKDNKDTWEATKLNGWKQFLNSDFCCEWYGFSVWSASGGSIDCHYEADLILKPVKSRSADGELSDALSKNPFMTREAIMEYYTEKISKYLDYEFNEYCTCDDYYQPVVEDFEMEYYVKAWCKENKFIVVSCEGNGYDDGYEPSFRH